MQDEQNFECLDKFGMRAVVSLVKTIKHEEEILDISEVLVRFVILTTDSVTVGIGSDCRNASQ